MVTVAVRLARGLVDGQAVNLTAFRGLTAAHVPVGRCDCSGWAYGGDVAPVRHPGGRWWFTVRCAACGVEAALPARPAGVGLAAA